MLVKGATGGKVSDGRLIDGDQPLLSFLLGYSLVDCKEAAEVFIDKLC